VAITRLWIDADACPRPIKEVLYRAAERVQIPLTLVANQPLYTPPSDLIDSVMAPAGYDEADAYIVDNLTAGDLVVTADIPLAAEVIKKEGVAINPRGELYTAENIAERLTMRDFMDQLRGSGVETGGPKPFDKKDVQTFANALDRFLAKR
jgi:hypothetical protein